jgi:hypothetical protein
VDAGFDDPPLRADQELQDNGTFLAGSCCVSRIFRGSTFVMSGAISNQKKRAAEAARSSLHHA